MGPLLMKWEVEAQRHPALWKQEKKTGAQARESASLKKNKA